jgi:hypothetical protein
MTAPRGIMTCALVFALAAGLQAQTSTTTKEAGTAQVTTTQITGEVVLVDGISCSRGCCRADSTGCSTRNRACRPPSTGSQ